MRRIVLTGIALTMALPVALAQNRVAPPTPVESAPLAAPTQAQTPPRAVPDPVPGPTPVQPAPAPQGPVTPQPVQPPPTPSVPLEPQPVNPPPTLPPPPAPGAAPPAAPQQQTQQQTGVPDPQSTLAGRKGDPSDVDPVVLVSKPVLIVPGQSSWDQGFEKLTASFRVLRDEAAKAGLAIAGRPLTLFVETDDNGFRYEAMLPVSGNLGGRIWGPNVRPGQSPSGQSWRFVHNAPYDDIDSTYETITAYLEAKSIAVKDAFLEEYVSDLKDPVDPNLEINVYVQPR